MSDWVLEKIAERLGGAHFEATGGYKFDVIHRLKCEAQAKHPQLPCLDFGIGEPDERADDSIIDSLFKAAQKPENRFYANNGADFLKKTIQSYLRAQFGVDLEAEREILPILGIKSGLSLLAGTLIHSGD